MTSTFPGGSETVFTYGAPLLKFGTGASDEIGYDLAQDGARRVLVVTDPGVAATGAPARVAGAMRRHGVEALVYDGVHVEPTDASLRAAAGHASEHGPFDAYVAVGGGSSIDTAKAVNLLTTKLTLVMVPPWDLRGRAKQPSSARAYAASL
jgi:hydroxyacid-oxoacid transhydrogenase